MAAKIRKGDKVVVLTGRDKGRTGEVIEVRPRDGRALVRGVNMVKRHQRQTAQQEGGIISKETTIHLSNLALADPKDGKPTRVGFKIRRRGRRPQEGARSPSVRESRSMAEQKDRSREGRQGRQARRRRATSAGGEAEAPRRKARRAKEAPKVKKPREPEEKVTPRLRTHFDEVVRTEAHRAVRLQEPHAGAA